MTTTLAAAELLQWRRRQLEAGGEASQLDWLLDLEGGIRWQTLQQLRLYPDQSVELEAPLPRLELLWQQHLNGGTPLQYLVGRCPWRDLELEVQPLQLRVRPLQMEVFLLETGLKEIDP